MLLAATIAAIAVGAGVLAHVGGLPQEFADAKPTKKIHFTATVASSQDPGQGHGGHQMALLLSPERGVIYDGSVTYVADAPVQIAVLHEMDAAESRGQPVWTIDGKTIYGLSLIGAGGGAGGSGSMDFTGAALALRSPGSEPFVATASVDGWIRVDGDPGAAGPAPMAAGARQDPPPPRASADLYRASVPVTIPLHSGLYDGNRTLYIVTDSSDGQFAEKLSGMAGRGIGTAPPLSGDAAAPAAGELYLFTNGVPGDGLHGFQDDVFSSTPGQGGEYSALREVVSVSWKPGQTPAVLGSAEDILGAEEGGRIAAERTAVVVNAPQIVWPDGRMQVRDREGAAAAAAGGDPRAGGQILAIDEEGGTVTFAAHRGWAPDGRTAYRIVVDATPAGPAGMMGVAAAPALAELAGGPAVADLYQFKNGLPGTGLLGFQPAVASVSPGDGSYTPLWRILLVEWHDEGGAKLLETVGDIRDARDAGLVTVSTARPLNADHVINSPFVDPFQDLKG